MRTLHDEYPQVVHIAADRTDTTVEILPADASKGRDVKAAEQTTVDYADGVLRIETAVKNQYFGPSGSIEVTVQLPAGSGIEAKAASAEFSTTGPLGDITYESSVGAAVLDAGTSPGRITNALENDGTADLTITATTSNGDITARSL
ncbi:hypothetical protein AB0L00_21205 [Actinoallomurus sp. NPDC052308]|uniref:hypothetical protein n=1 Tax=Actinoallomurus sp. NPDC052308 TaxID=3155530 RepID=UPI00343B7AA7